MSILTFYGYTPPARYDDVPWTSARIEQAATETGSYTLVEQIDLDPVDTDPRDPQPRGFTTEIATAGDWYRLVWVDDDGNQSAATTPVQLVDESVAYGDRAELAKRLKIDETTNAAALDRCLQSASLEINSEIGRTDLSGWEMALADEVAIERAAEHWNQLTSPFGLIGLGVDTGPAFAARDSWERHAFKLAPLKGSWGIA